MTANTAEPVTKRRPIWRWYTYLVAIAWWPLFALIFAAMLGRTIDRAGMLFGFIVVCGFWWLTWASRHGYFCKINAYFEEAAAEAAASKATREADQKARLLEWASGALPPLQPAGLILKPGETCYWTEPATMGVIKTTTRRSGGYGGVSVRVPGVRGLRVNTGRFGSRNISRSGLASQPGSLAVTDRRLVFASSADTKTVPLTKLVGIHPFTDGVKLDIENSTPIIFLTGNPYTSMAIERIIHRDIGSVAPSTVNFEAR